ncbi:hypothetical protein BC831DRAFT_549664 [Entophlyctis helioformis]|nr:hypothetical protein BC831DRAFT_549664 [Entophlyctis helioformis]
MPVSETQPLLQNDSRRQATPEPLADEVLSTPSSVSSSASSMLRAALAAAAVPSRPSSAPVSADASTGGNITLVEDDAMRRRRQRRLARRQRRLGVIFLAVAVSAFILQSEVVQYVQGPKSFYKPWFILYVAHGFYAAFLPMQLLYTVCVRGDPTDSYWSRIVKSAGSLLSKSPDDLLPSAPQQSYASLPTSLPSANAATTDASLSGLSEGWIYLCLLGRTSLLTLLFTCGALSWYVSVSKIPMSDVTAIYNTSCFFTYVLSTVLLKESLQLRKVAAVCLSVTGIGLIALLGERKDPGTIGGDAASVTIGYAAATTASICVALYEVLYTRLVVPSPPSISFSLHITGLIGVVTLLGGLPLFPILHYTGLEVFEWPDTSAWMYITLIAVLGIVFNALFMLVMAFVGPVLAAVGILMTIPLTTVVDVIVTGQSVGWNTVAGSVAILGGFALLHGSEVAQ